MCVCVCLCVQGLSRRVLQLQLRGLHSTMGGGGSCRTACCTRHRPWGAQHPAWPRPPLHPPAAQCRDQLPAWPHAHAPRWHPLLAAAALPSPRGLPCSQPLPHAHAALQFATEAAITILRIDDLITLDPVEGEGED